MDLKNNLLYTLLSNPGVYLRKLLIATFYIGVVTFFMSWIYINSDFHEIKVPPTMHGLIGIVIGLLLVFRTNTAYDRWWEGRKAITGISNAVSFFSIKIKNSALSDTSKNKEIFDHINSFLINLQIYLIEKPKKDSLSFHSSQMKEIDGILKKIKELEKFSGMLGRDASALENYLKEMLDFSNVCERIKNTPIPISYALHIKISIFIYLLSLPFGLFYDLGLWSTLMVMLIFYLIAGIEIISNEIEDPFAGEPNDLPTEILINNIINSSKEVILNYEKTK